jgi:hypothetical protein
LALANAHPRRCLSRCAFDVLPLRAIATTMPASLGWFPRVP